MKERKINFIKIHIDQFLKYVNAMEYGCFRKIIKNFLQKDKNYDSKNSGLHSHYNTHYQNKTKNLKNVSKIIRTVVKNYMNRLKINQGLSTVTISQKSAPNKKC